MKTSARSSTTGFSARAKVLPRLPLEQPSSTTSVVSRASSGTPSPSPELVYHPHSRSPTCIYDPPTPPFVIILDAAHSREPNMVPCVPPLSPSLMGLQPDPGPSHGNGTEMYPNGPCTQWGQGMPPDVIGSYLDHLSYGINTGIVPFSPSHPLYPNSLEHVQVTPEENDSIRPSLLTKLIGRKQKAKFM